MAINILLVDDSAVMRTMIRKTIELSRIRTGEIYEAENGREGLRILRQSQVDLLFLDVNMPVMGGIEMLEKVRKMPETKELPVLIVSTESHPDRIREFNRMKAQFVHKPFTAEDLRARIIRMLSSRVVVDPV